jgi:hypothetical protein
MLGFIQQTEVGHGTGGEGSFYPYPGLSLSTCSYVPTLQILLWLSG